MSRNYKSSLRMLLAGYTGNIPSQRTRLFVYRHLFGMSIGAGSVVYSGCEIREPSKIKIGKNCSIGTRAILDGRRSICIEDNVNVSTGAWIWTMQHDMNDPDFVATGAKVHIESYVWVGGRVIILPGVHVGKGAVLASGAVVTKNVDPYAIMGGVPARKIGERSKHLRYKLVPCMHFV